MTIVAPFAGRLDALRKRFFPRDLFCASGLQREPVAVRLESLAPSHINQAAATTASVTRPADVRLAPNLVLQREVTVPLAALRRADEAISMTMRQSLPAQGKGLIWRKSSASRTKAGATFTIFVVKQDHLNAIREAFKLHGQSVRSVGVDGSGVAPFFVEGETSGWAKLWQRGTLACITGLLLWTISAPLLQSRQLAADNLALEADLDAMKEKLVALRATSDERKKAGAKIGDAVAILNRDRQRTEILASLTETLPDDVWVSELTITGSTVYLAAFTNTDVTGVLNRLAGLPWVETARLDGPIIPDSVSGESRFQAVLIAKAPS